MQYHLNGVGVGDPSVAAEQAPQGGALPDRMDVLIVGCGPAGLILAAQLAQFAGIASHIIERKDGPLQMGQADGIACRTVEMFEAIGIAHQVLREAYWVNETAFWKPDPESPSLIRRNERIRDTEEGLSEFPHVILNQARVHDLLLDRMAKGPRRMAPHYGWAFADHCRDDDAEHPVRVQLSDASGAGRPDRFLRCRYLVGCDGARSAVRRSMGLTLRGDSANKAWGVMDILARSDFPDLRIKSVIQSASEGSVLIIPREGGYLVRLYIEMDKLGPDERAAGRDITAEQLIAAAQRILHPYTLDVQEVAWWSVYDIGQRLADRFDDGAEGSPRVFICGDACHTHSPKAGQGMNVSMQDGFNLGWKLAAVLRGQAAPGLLESYSTERQAVAEELIAFDRSFARIFSTPPEAVADRDRHATELQRSFVRHGRFTAGTATCYAPSTLIAAAPRQALARGLPVGMRFHSAPVIRVADARPMELGHVAEADGRWRLYAFAGAGDTGQQGGAVARLCDRLGTDGASP
ncbi:phenol 2-monooxygenase, partial [Sulfitobacter sp. HI0040]|uniref:FAD-dependent monooxygenase n=1 Tax=Sulfitobacter sp. HI0040 TaxID=1822232 RepID=UPI0007C385E7